jgi:DNA-binding protein H-NS
MTPTYSQLQRQIETLQRQADKLRDAEIKGVVDRIKVAISEYGLTAQQLGFGVESSGTAKAPKASVSQSAKYADEQGNVWTGRGPRPHWLRDALNAGKKLADFATGSTPTKPGRAKAKATGKRKAKALYRDQAGNSWTGMGPRPRWLKQALDAGLTLEQLAA